MKPLLSIFLFIIATTVNAQQEYYSKSKKAVKYFESALNNYNLLYFDIAKQELAKALKKDPKFIDAYILLGEIAFDEGKKQEAINNFTKAISIKKDYNPLMYLRRADIEKSCGMYEKAKADYLNFMKLQKNIDSYEKYVNRKIENCDFAIKLKKNPVKFKAENIGNQINTALSEYWTSITADGNTIIFTVSDRQKNSQEDLYFSTKVNGKWQKASKMSAPINTPKSEGAQSISADGKTMVFASDMPEGFGGMDLYITHWDGTEWSKPKNLGREINTAGEEIFPFIHEGGDLYFSSNMRIGIGGLDIFVAKRKDKDKWADPVNVGAPLNSPRDDFGLILRKDKK